MAKVEIDKPTIGEALLAINDDNFETMSLYDLKLNDVDYVVAEKAIKHYRKMIGELFESMYFDRDPKPPKVGDEEKIIN